jgi:hypothetical protein
LLLILGHRLLHNLGAALSFADALLEAHVISEVVVIGLRHVDFHTVDLRRKVGMLGDFQELGEVVPMGKQFHPWT